jgi:Cu2+-exporting ATPase
MSSPSILAARVPEPALRSMAAARAPARCFHCGEPIAPDAFWRLALHGEEREFCCGGCQAIARTIHAAGLDAFYAQRTAAAGARPAVSDEWAQYDVVAETRGLLTRVDDEVCEVSLLIEGIECAACIWLSETYLRGIEGVLEFDVNFATHRARLRWNTRRAKLSDLLRALGGIGYRAYPYDPQRREALARRDGRALLLRMAIALLAMMQVMMFAVPAYISVDGIDPSSRRLLDWASLALTLPVVLYCAAPFFRNAWRDLRLRQPGMDVPVALGVGGAFAASVWATLTGEGATYFDSVSMFVALLLVARYVEFRARQKAGDGIEALAREQPETAERLADFPACGRSEIVAASRLAVGEHIRVPAGASIPADGVVADGRSMVAEALLTGESRPRPKESGSTVLAGSINGESPLIVRVTAAGQGTTAAGLARLVERAASERPRFARLADRTAALFVAALLILSAAVGLAWWSHDAARALGVVFAVLVVSCPCALSLATPASLAIAAGSLGRRGVLAVRADALEALSRVTHVVFDKTGTLTSDRVRLVAVEVSPRANRVACLSLAAALEQGSTHPIANALRASSAIIACARDVTSIPGHGVDGIVDGRRYRCGRLEWVAEIHGQPLPAAAIASDALCAVLGDESGWLARFTFADSPKAGAAELVAALIKTGIGVSLVSGDHPAQVERVAAGLGIADWHGAVLPEEKCAYIAALQRSGEVVAMVGDGINDAASLAQADVSLSFGCAAPLAQWTADIVVLGDDLDDIRVAVSGAQSTFRVIRQNLVWAVAYNAVAIPLAAAGQLTPLAAAAGMSLSSMLVVANALRLSRIARKGHASGRWNGAAARTA